MRSIRTTITSILAAGLLASSAVGVAAQDTADTAVTGSLEYVNNASADFYAERGVRTRSPGVIVTTSDPRLTGTANVTTYGVNSRRGEGFSEAGFGTDVVTLETDEGSWSGGGPSVLVLDPFFEEATWLLTGEGAYDGLYAYLARRDDELVGYVVEARPPEVPSAE